MLNFKETTLRSLAMHKVGNRARNEGILVSKGLHEWQDEVMTNMLMDYFLTPFKYEEYHQFTHSSDIDMNEVYTYCRHIFENKLHLYDQSVNIARHLYNQSTHPKIKGGELFICLFANCQLDDEVVDAVGIFKSELKDAYLKPETNKEELNLNYQKGINIKKLDKGCIIFNTLGDYGYRVLSVDKLAKTHAEAQYWKTDFLNITRVHDNIYNTESYLSMCQNFVEDVYAEEGANKKDQILLLTKSLNFFTEHESFDPAEFEEQVLEASGQSENFQDYKADYETENGFASSDGFQISKQAVKTMKRKFKKIIELDTGMDIKIKSETSEQYIERDFDPDRQMYFYKVFFNEEA